MGWYLSYLSWSFARLGSKVHKTSGLLCPFTGFSPRKKSDSGAREMETMSLFWGSRMDYIKGFRWVVLYPFDRVTIILLDKIGTWLGHALGGRAKSCACIFRSKPHYSQWGILPLCLDLSLAPSYLSPWWWVAGFYHCGFCAVLCWQHLLRSGESKRNAVCPPVSAQPVHSPWQSWVPGRSPWQYSQVEAGASGQLEEAVLAGLLPASAVWSSHHHLFQSLPGGHASHKTFTTSNSTAWSQKIRIWGCQEGPIVWSTPKSGLSW